MARCAKRSSGRTTGRPPGTGPILGPIQGILFGPIAFITIPIGNIIGGAMHDYFCGMICLRDGGTQMSEMIRKYTNKGIFTVYNIFVCVLLLLVGAVFVRCSASPARRTTTPPGSSTA